MRVTKTIKTDEGIFTIEADFTPEEYDLIFEAGLNYLLKVGALPFITVEEGEESRLSMQATPDQ